MHDLLVPSGRVVDRQKPSRNGSLRDGKVHHPEVQQRLLPVAAVASIVPSPDVLRASDVAMRLRLRIHQQVNKILFLYPNVSPWPLTFRWHDLHL